MPRPHKCRLVGDAPRVTAFKPSGVPGHQLQTVELGLDELEALRLSDVEGLYHDDAAARMGISRPTFGRVLQRARNKVATALLNGHMLVFQGGTVATTDGRTFGCSACEATWRVPFGTERPDTCPRCGADNIGRVDDDAGRRRRGGGRGCGRGHGGGGGRRGHRRGCDQP